MREPRNLTPTPDAVRQTVEQVMQRTLLKECDACHLTNEVCDHQFESLRQGIAGAIHTAYTQGQQAEQEFWKELAQEIISGDYLRSTMRHHSYCDSGGGVNEFDQEHRRCRCNVGRIVRAAEERLATLRARQR